MCHVCFTPQKYTQDLALKLLIVIAIQTVKLVHTLNVVFLQYMLYMGFKMYTDFKLSKCGFFQVKLA